MASFEPYASVVVDPTWQHFAPGSVITYSFLTSAATNYHPSNGPYIEAVDRFSEDQKLAIREIARTISQIANVSFVEVAPGLASDIRMFNADLSAAPNYPGGANAREEEGSIPKVNDVIIDARYTDPTPGGFGYFAPIHELLHAIGLKHQDDPPVVDPNVDRETSIMSTLQALHAPDVFGVTPLLYDVAALQQIFGVNTGFNNTDTVYRFSPQQLTSLADTVIFEGQRRAIWDAAGDNDWLDASEYTAAAGLIDYRVNLDLLPGAMSSVGGLTNNVVIAIGSQIENARGGGGNDRLSADIATRLKDPCG